jgi:hypothetical protein
MNYKGFKYYCTTKQTCNFKINEFEFEFEMVMCTDLLLLTIRDHKK